MRASRNVLARAPSKLGIYFLSVHGGPMTRALLLRCPCGAGFSADMPRAGRPPRFCSDDCRKEARRRAPRRLINKRCEVCEHPFNTPSRVIVCCGPVCGQVLAKRRSDAVRSANATARAKRFCEACGAEFTMRNPSGKARSGTSHEGRFCSRKCHAQFIRHPRQLDLFGRATAPDAGTP
jgi:hypothetical protein